MVLSIEIVFLLSPLKELKKKYTGYSKFTHEIIYIQNVREEEENLCIFCEKFIWILEIFTKTMKPNKI